MVPLLVSKDVASECFGRFFFLKGQALFHAFWHRILPCLSWKQLELEHPVSSLENYIYFWMFFVVKQLLKLCCVENLPATSWTSMIGQVGKRWQWPVQLRGVLAGWCPGDMQGSLQSKVQQLCSLCFTYQITFRNSCYSISTLWEPYNKRNVCGPIPFSPTTMKSRMLVGTFQSSVARESCKGIEFNPDLRRCEVWIKPVCYSGGFLLQAVLMTFFQDNQEYYVVVT